MCNETEIKANARRIILGVTMQDIGTDNAPIQTKLAAARICMELGLLPDEQLISQFDKLLAEDTAPSRLADLHETVSEVEKELMRWCEDCTE